MDNVHRITNLMMDWQHCAVCPIGEWAHRHVFGRGDANARVMMIGEAPGKTEDLSGLPFTGLAGQLLDEAIKQTGVAVSIYFSNLLMCRPSNSITSPNRAPQYNEIINCRNRLRKTFTIIQPLVVIALGRIPDEYVPIEMKENSRYYNTYHPAYILRNGGITGSLFPKYVEALRRMLKNAL